MGFMGLANYTESDNASDFHAKLRLAIRSMFREELKNKANKYNTPGWLNALLIFKEYPSMAQFLDLKTLDCIDEEIEKDQGYLVTDDGYELIRNFRTLRMNKHLYREF